MSLSQTRPGIRYETDGPVAIITIDRPQLSPEAIKKLEEGLKKVEAGRE